MRSLLLALVVLVAMLCAAGPVVAAEKSLRAQRRSALITIDGRLDEPDWARAPRGGGFWQHEPHEGRPPKFKTQVRVLFDDEAIYVGVRAFDPQPHRIRGVLTRRDEDSTSDWVLVGIDSYHDRRTAFVFALNAAGVQRDLLLFDDTSDDDSWNAVWTGEATIDAQGWVAEFRIPLSQLRFASKAEQKWGFQVLRKVQRTAEESVWSRLPKSKPRFVSLFGELHGVQITEQQKRRVEVLPYIVGGAHIPAAEPDDPFGDVAEPIYRTGLDFKYGLTSNLTLSGTVNPDFGQVEADPSQINLSAQEVFFEEKRSFFLEGGDIIRFGLGQGDGGGSRETLFYSRRIGASPHGSGSEHGDDYRQDQNTTIIGAAKLTGKTAGRWSLGFMNAMTSEETAEVRYPSGSRRHVIIEPLTNYAIARIKKDVNEGRTTFGVGATSVNRRLEGTSMDDLHTSAYAGGIEFGHRFAEDMWSVNGRMAASHVRGSKEAISRTQRSSQRYFQRPDADHVEYDPERTSLSGIGGLGSIGRMGGDHWRAAVGGDTRSPGFEVNDVGFQREADYFVGWLWTQYRDEEPGRFVKDYQLNFNAWTGNSWEPENTSNGGSVNVDTTLNSYWSGGVGYNVNLGRVNKHLLRGGPSVRGHNGHNWWLNIQSDRRRKVFGGLFAGYRTQPEVGSAGVDAGLQLVVQARSNLELSLGPNFGKRVDNQQFVTEALDTDGAPHYVLAQIEQTTLALTLRLDYTIFRDLSVQVYAQPFVSVGGYDDYKESDDVMAEAYGDRFHMFGEDEVEFSEGTYTVTRSDGSGSFSYGGGDFNFRELRSNVVLRWEYNPGSTLAFIWSQGRSSAGEAGRMDLGNDLEKLLDSEGEHVILLKLSHWFGS